MTNGKTIVSHWIVILGVAVTGLAQERTSWSKILEQANTAFRQANAQQDPDQQKILYDKAILSYERLIQEAKIHNGKLYYNLGNAYMLSGDIGRAILNYRRALLYRRGDTNVHKNLTFARSRRIDHIPLRTEKRILETLFFWHYDFSLKTRTFWACLLFGLSCCGATWIVWRGRGSLNVALLIVSVLLMLCFGASVAVESINSRDIRFGVILDAQTVARQGDGFNYPESFKHPLHAGTEFQLLEQRPGWWKVTLTDGTEAWLEARACEKI